MKQLKSRWPAVYVRVPPELHARIEAEAEDRVLPVGEIVRERLARAYGQKAPSGHLRQDAARDPLGEQLVLRGRLDLCHGHFPFSAPTGGQNLVRWWKHSNAASRSPNAATSERFTAR